MFNLGIMNQKNNAWICGVNTDTDPYFSDVVSLWHCDSNTDAVAGTWSLNAAPAITALAHGCASAAVCNGSDNTGFFPNFTLNAAFLTTNWTLEFFANVQSHSTIQTLMCKCADNGANSDGYSEISLDIEADGRISYTTFPNGTQSTKQTIASTSTITYNKWLHIALVQTGSTTSIFVDGVLFAQGVVWRPNGPYWGLRLASFGYPNFRQQSEAAFDEFRMTQNIARYTGNFTPPNRQFPDS